MPATAWKALSLLLAILLASFMALTLWRSAVRESLGIDLIEERLNLCERMLLEKEIR